MNAIKIYDKVRKELNHIEFELKTETRDKVEFTADIVAEKYFDDSVYTKITAYASGTTHVSLTFDELEENEQTYSLINKLNEETAFAKAYIAHINDKTFLQLHYAFFSTDEKEAASNIVFSILNLLDDDVLEYLKPLTELTK